LWLLLAYYVYGFCGEGDVFGDVNVERIEKRLRFQWRIFLENI
jgi:hypothetical protein